jgi:hypothetical protein
MAKNRQTSFMDIPKVYFFIIEMDYSELPNRRRGPNKHGLLIKRENYNFSVFNREGINDMLDCYQGIYSHLSNKYG